MVIMVKVSDISKPLILPADLTSKKWLQIQTIDRNKLVKQAQ